MARKKNLPITGPYRTYLNRLIKASLAEDIGPGDITTESIIPRTAKGHGIIVAKEEMVVAGLFVANKVFRTVGRDIIFEPMVEDGELVDSGTVIARVTGRLSRILTAERVALNFLQRLSGIATLTREFVNRLGDTHVRILDTRKTTPCLRVLEKYAVKAGGGFNHRFGLFDAILIKDNHIDAVGGIREAVTRLRSKKKTASIHIEVETRGLDEVGEAVESGADIIMLDNMDIADIKRAVKKVAGRARLEVSGGVNIKNISRVARTGIDFISIGAITHSVRAKDISLKIEDIR